MSPRLLGENEAVLAQNCVLYNGKFRPLRAPSQAATLARTGTIQTLYKWVVGATERWFQFATDVDVVPDVLATDATGKTCYTDGTLPRITNSVLVDIGGDDIYPESSYPLGIPAPTNAITAVPSGVGGTGDDRELTYCYTFGRVWADGTIDEGPPSPVSAAVFARNGELVDLSNIDAAVAGRADISKVYIYRVNSGSSGAEFQYLGTVNLGVVVFADNYLDATLGEVLATDGWIAPPDDLRGLVSMGDFLAGFSGNQICFCVPGHAHAWPLDYRRTVNGTVGLGVLGSSLVVLTTGRPALITGSDPAFMGTPEFLPDPQPCLSKRGIVSCKFGVIYPCPDGLYQIGPEGAGMATPDVVLRREWAAYHPETMHAVWHGDRYYGFWSYGGSSGGVVIDFSGTGARMRTVGFCPMAAVTDPSDGTLYYAQASGSRNLLWQFEGNDAANLTGTWTSREFVGPFVNFGALRIDADFEPVLSAEEQAAREASRDAVIAANQAAIDAGIFEGCFGGMVFNALWFNGSGLALVPEQYTEPAGVTFELYGVDGNEPVLRHSLTQKVWGDKRLPAGFKDRVGYFRFSSDVDVNQVVLATSMRELA